MRSLVLKFAVSLVALTGPARSQCQDFTPNFGPGSGFGGTAEAMLSFDDGSGTKLYVGGMSVRRWNGAAWQNLGNAAGPTLVECLAAYDSGGGAQLYVGGGFSLIGGVSASNVARWDGAAWHPLGLGVNGRVRDMLVFDDGSGAKLYCTGSFASAGGQTAMRVARWDGTAWTPLGSLLSNVFGQELEVFDSGFGPQVHALFQGPQALKRWDGASWITLGGYGQQLSTQTDMLVHNDGSGGGAKLFIAGQSLSVASGLARWDGTSMQSLPGAAPGEISSLCVRQENGVPRLYVAGGTIGGATLPTLSTWNGAAFTPITGSISGTIKSMARHDDGAGDRLYIGGSVSVNGAPVAPIARYGDPCSRPVITLHPANAAGSLALVGQTISFNVQAAGTQPLSYQWRVNGSPLANVAGEVEGATTPLLQLVGWRGEHAGSIDCLVSNPSGSTASNAATFTVPMGPSGEPWNYARRVYVGQPVSGAPGSTISGSGPLLTAADGGTLAFCSLQGASSGGAIVHVTNSGATLVARSSQPAPGCEAGALISGFDASRVAAQTGGRARFSATLSNVTLPFGDRAIYEWDGAQLVLRARQGQPAPGPAGRVLQQIYDFLSNDSGRFVLRSLDSGPGYSGRSLHAFDPQSGGTQLLADGSPAPGLSTTVRDASTFPWAIDAQGTMAVMARVNSQTGYRGFGIDPYDSVVWVGQPNALQVVLRSGDQAIGYSPGVNIEHPSRLLFGGPNDLWVTTSVAGPAGFRTFALYRYHQGQLSLQLAEGDPAPLAVRATLGGPNIVDVNANGDVLFSSSVWSNCSPCPQRGVFLLSQGQIHVVVSDFNGGLPGYPASVDYASVVGAALNAQRQVVVRTDNIGPFNSSALESVFGWTPERGLFPLLVPGWQLATTQGLRTISTVGEVYGVQLSLAGPLRLSLTDQGEVDLSAGLTSVGGLYVRANFQDTLNQELGPALSVCAGDGTSIPCPCANLGTSGRGCANSTGDGGRLVADGTARLAQDDLRFDADGLPPNKGALLFQSLAGPGGAVGVPLKDGIRCATGATRRFELRDSDANGAVGWGPSLAAQGAWQAGVTQYFQVWYRDGNTSPCGKLSNLTNALQVTFTP